MLAVKASAGTRSSNKGIMVQSFTTLLCGVGEGLFCRFWGGGGGGRVGVGVEGGGVGGWGGRGGLMLLGF